MNFLLFFSAAYQHLATAEVEGDQITDLHLTEIGMQTILSLVDTWRDEGIPVQERLANEDQQTIRFKTTIVPLDSPGSLQIAVHYAAKKNWRTVLVQKKDLDTWLRQSFLSEEEAYRSLAAQDLLSSGSL